MRTYGRYIMGSLLGIILILGMCGEAAAAGNVTYTGDARRFIFSPGSDYSPTDLFENFKDVMPGDKISQQIIIKNSSKDSCRIKVYMRAAGAKKESEAFLSQIRLRVEKEGDRDVLFDAPAGETGGLTQWTLLGTVWPGGKIPLNLQLEIPLSLGNEYQDSIGYLDWEFKVEEIPEEKDDPRAPKTGDVSSWAGLAVAFMTSLTVMAVLIIFIGKRKKKQG